MRPRRHLTHEYGTVSDWSIDLNTWWLDADRSRPAQALKVDAQGQIPPVWLVIALLVKLADATGMG